MEFAQKHIVFIAIVAVVLLIALGIGLGLGLRGSDDPPIVSVSCLPECNTNPDQGCPPDAANLCHARGCNWDDGKCYYGSSYSKYQIDEVRVNVDDDSGISYNVYPPSMFGDSGEQEDLIVKNTVSTLMERTLAENGARVVLRQDLVSSESHTTISLKQAKGSRNAMTPSCSNNDRFNICVDPSANYPNLQVFDHQSNDLLIDFSEAPMIAEKMYLQETLNFKGFDKIYGLGEDHHDTFQRKKGEVVTVWSVGPLNPAPKNKNLWGAHMVLAAVNSRSGDAIGMHIYPFGGGYVEFTFEEDNVITVRYGSQEGYTMQIMPGPTFAEVKKQLFEGEKKVYSSGQQSLYTKPYVDLHIPYWAFGLQVGSTVFDGLAGMEKMVNDMEAARMPFDGFLHTDLRIDICIFQRIYFF